MSLDVVDGETSLLPPHDLDAEAAVLSAVLLKGGPALASLSDFLLPEHFYSEAHRVIYLAAIEVYQSGSAVDPTTVGSRLKAKDQLLLIGGAGYLAEVMAVSPDLSNVRDHATSVHERWRARQIILLCQRAAARGYRAVDVQEYADEVTQAVASIARQRPGVKAESNTEVLRRMVRQMQETAYATEQVAGKGISTGIKGWDSITLGLHPGQKTTIVAPPRVGKTALALQLATTVIEQGMAVAFFSTEMRHEELADRQLASAASVDSRRIQLAKQKKVLEAAEWQRILLALSKLEEHRDAFHVYDDSSPTIGQICAIARRLHETALSLYKRPLGMVVVDYIQKLRFDPRQQLTPQIRFATEALKSLAKDLGIVVVELAQEKNQEVDRKGKLVSRPKPRLGNAADCFQIERSADNVAYLWRPDEHNSREVKLVFVKNRQGTEGTVDLKFEVEFSRFVDDPYGVGVEDEA